jgi:hypothetical protein
MEYNKLWNREHALKSIRTIDMMIRLGENLKHINETNAEN